MHFNLKKFLDNGQPAYETSGITDYSTWDFPGFKVQQPAEYRFTAKNLPDGAELLLSVNATVDAECARCLAPVEEQHSFTKEYFVRPRDLEDVDFELPLDDTGCLNLEELVYQELIFEVPGVLLCSPDCLGLCPVCGKRKAAGCACQPTGDAAPADARLSILKQLLS